MRWRCTKCGNTHLRNPSECEKCGNTILEQKRWHWRESLGVIWVQTITTTRTLIRGVGLLVALIAALNIVVLPNDPILAVYREPLLSISPRWMISSGVEAGIYVPDLILLVIGAVVVWRL